MSAASERLAPREGIDTRLARVYARIPAVACRGLCRDSCTTIDMTSPERARLADRGYHLPARVSVADLRRTVVAGGEVPTCPVLSALGACRAYDVRPFICRLFGSARGLRCQHGCVPERVLSELEVLELFDELHDIERQATEEATTP